MIISICINVDCIYAINVATIGLDDSLMSSYLSEDESGNDDIKKVINDFRMNFIMPNMSDFEIEMQIIKYLVETVTYDIEELSNPDRDVSDTYKAYGALINHKAVCSGYAKAFDLLAKNCGLSTTIATGTGFNNYQNGPHAWNQIYLDDEWYNVDVTWEDPITNMHFGFDNLLNEYINRTDAEFSKDHRRDTGNACIATKYGKNTVSYYLVTGIVNTSPNMDELRKNLENQIIIYYEQGNNDIANALIDKLIYLGANYDKGANYFPDNNDTQITEYVLSKISSGDKIISIVTGKNSAKNLSIDSGHFLNDYVTQNISISMQVHFFSDGEKDTRIIIINRK